MAQDSSLQIKDIPLAGKLVTAVDSAFVGENFVTLTNMRYTDVNPETIGGMTKINSTAIPTYPKVRNGYHFKRSQPAETHVLVQAYNSGLTASQVLQNTTAIPSAGDFSATALHTDGTGAGRGRFDAAPTGEVAYCNGVESLLWAGDEQRCSGFVNYDPGGAFSYDFTDQVTNTLTTEKATVSLSSGGVDADTILMLHLDNNVTDSSPTTPHTVTNTNVTFSTTAVFGTHSAVFNGTNAKLTVPNDADFNFTDGTWTVDARVNVDDLASTYPLYCHYHEMDSLAFTSGGTYEVVPGDTIAGQVSLATAIIEEVVLTSGTWAGGDAAGSFYFRTADKTGTFQSENVNVGASTNVATIAGDSASAGNDCFLIDITTGGSVRFQITKASSNNELSLTSTSGIITAGNWYHVEICENGSSYYIFIDGILRGYTSSAIRPEENESVVHLGYDDNLTTYLKGKVDELRVSDICRHTADFEVPASAYTSANTAAYFYVGSVRPLKGMKFYIGTANTSAGTLAVQYWNGSSWVAASSVSDGTASGGAPLAQTGTVTFTDTKDVAKVKYVNQTYIYWYKVYIDACDSGTSIYYATLSASMQSVKDIWDGQARQCLSFQKYDGSTFQDLTINVKDEDFSSANTATFAELDSLATSTSYIVAGFVERQAGLLITMVGGAVNTTAGTVATVKYWNGTTWATVGDIDDGTLEGGVSFAKSGVIAWNPPASTAEFKTEISKEFQLYYYRIDFSKTLSADVKLDYLGGIPAQKEIRGFRFPLYAQDRLWLCSDQAKDKNAVTVSANGTSVVFNGADSYTFYFGDDTEVVAGASIYSQFGSSLYDIVVMCKTNETWIVAGSGPEDWRKYPASKKIGCAAPLTMTNTHLDVEAVPGLNRHVGIWQAADGIYIFDGRTFFPIHKDIEDVFDKRNPNGINRSKIGDSVGFIDDQNQEWHWLWASGSSTTLDKEYIYDIRRQRWYTAERPADLQYGLSVSDTSGNTYNYGFIDTGYMERLESGNTFDGSDITGTLETGEIFLGGSPAIETTVRAAKLTMAAKTTTTNTVTFYHYGDSASAATLSRSYPPAASGKTVAMPLHNEKLGPYTTHRVKLAMTTNNETVGFEPLILSLLYKSIRLDRN